jgi:hypothetical protein
MLIYECKKLFDFFPLKSSVLFIILVISFVTGQKKKFFRLFLVSRIFEKMNVSFFSTKKKSLNRAKKVVYAGKH